MKTDWNWILDSLKFQELNWINISMRAGDFKNYGNLPHIGYMFRGLKATFSAFSKHSVLVCHTPRVTLYVAIAARLLRIQVPLISLEFNFPELPVGKKLSLMRWAFSTVDRFVVSSTYEKKLYSQLFNIASDRIDMVYWPEELPEVNFDEAPLESGDYICAIGGNARDYATLISSASKMPDVRFVIVTWPQNLRELHIPPNVRVRYNIPFVQVLNIIHYSRFMALVLRDSETCGGHITLVLGMYLRKAIVATDSIGIRDYVKHGYNALLCPAKNSVALCNLLKNLYTDRVLCDRLGSNGFEFAKANCNLKNISRWFVQYLQSKDLINRADVFS